MKKGAGRSITSPRSFFCLLILFTEHIFAVFRLTRLLSLPPVIASARCCSHLSLHSLAVAPDRCHAYSPLHLFAVALARSRIRSSSHLFAVAPARRRIRSPSHPFPHPPASAPVRRHPRSLSNQPAIDSARCCTRSPLLLLAVAPDRCHTCLPSHPLAVAPARERDEFCRKFFLPSNKICEKTKNKGKQMYSVFILKGDCLRFRRKRQKVFYFSEKAKFFLKKL